MAGMKKKWQIKGREECLQEIGRRQSNQYTKHCSKKNRHYCKGQYVVRISVKNYLLHISKRNNNQKVEEDDDKEGGNMDPSLCPEWLFVSIKFLTMLTWAVTPRLPKIAHPFFKKSNEQWLSFLDCYVQIAMRLPNGVPPNLTALVRNLHFTISLITLQTLQTQAQVLGCQLLSNSNQIWGVKDTVMVMAKSNSC